jgi:hypothetical protein
VRFADGDGHTVRNLIRGVGFRNQMFVAAGHRHGVMVPTPNLTVPG